MLKNMQYAHFAAIAKNAAIAKYASMAYSHATDMPT